MESESDSEENETVGGGHSRPTSSSGSESADTATADASTPATVPQGNEIINESKKYTIRSAVVLLDLTSILPPSDKSRTIKYSRYLGQGFLILVAPFLYNLRCLHLFPRPSGTFFSFNTTNAVNVYFVVQGLRYPVIYGLGIWLCTNSHIHHVIKKVLFL